MCRQLTMVIAPNVTQGKEFARNNRIPESNVMTPRNYRTACRGKQLHRIICVGNPDITQEMANYLAPCFNQAPEPERRSAIAWLEYNAS